jgi:hypothetical protein
VCVPACAGLPLFVSFRGRSLTCWECSGPNLICEGVIALWARENVRPTPRLKVVRRGGTRTSRKGSTYYRLSRVNDNPVRSEAVEDNVLDASTGDDGALGGGTNVMLDGLRVASTRDVGVAIATNCQRRLRRHEVRRLFNHYMGVIVMFC